VLPAVNTTPESLDLERLFAELERMGGSHAVMEVSSHALALGRVYGLNFHTAIFTNLTRDHLDFHGTMEEYFAAKQLALFGCGRAAAGLAILNRDDELVRRVELRAECEALWFGLGQGVTVRARHITSNLQGLRSKSRTAKSASWWNRRCSARLTCTTFWRLLRGAELRIHAGNHRGGHRSMPAVPDASSALTKANRSQWWWTTRTPTMR